VAMLVWRGHYCPRKAITNLSLHPAPNAFSTRARQLLQEGAGAAMKTLSHRVEFILQLDDSAAYGLTVTITTP
jgi:hypothetical protein